MPKKIITALEMSGMLLASNSTIAEDATSKNDSLTPQSIDLSPLRNLNELDSPMDKDYKYH